MYADVSRDMDDQERLQTSVHGTQHAGDKPINSPAFLDKRDQGRYTTFVIGRMSEVCKDHFLEGFNLVLKSHQVRNRLVAVIVMKKETQQYKRMTDPSFGSS